MKFQVKSIEDLKKINAPHYAIERAGKVYNVKKIEGKHVFYEGSAGYFLKNEIIFLDKDDEEAFINNRLHD